MNRIWIGADWHLYNISNDVRHPFYSRYKIGKFAENFAQNIQDDDLLIFLGDLCDPAVTKLDDVASVIREIPCYKIMCRGNHDIQDDDFYKEIGFDEVTEVLRIHNMLFSHKPMKVAPDEINIHAHLHTEKLVTSGYQHINAYAANWNEDGGLILLEDLLDAASNQQIEIKPREVSHIQEKFEKYTTIESDVYTKIRDISDEFMLCPIDEASSMLKLPDFKSPEELSRWMKANIKYANFSKMKTADKVLRDRRGSCHDQVVLAYPLLKGMGLYPKILFFVAYKDGEPGGGMTHTLIYWEDGNKIKWFENAMGGMEGIHTFNSVDDMKDEIRKIYANMPDSKKYPELYFKNISIGQFYPDCNLGEFVEDIVDDKLDEAQDEPLDEILFPDVESTKYWLNDDKSFRKKADKGDAEAADTAGVAIDESVTLYRYTYNGRGIYNELKDAMPFEDWKKLKRTNTLSWLPVPDVYDQSDVKYTSFFTDVGKRTFDRKVLPLIDKYLDSNKVALTSYDLKDSDDIAYSDKYQTVIPADRVTNCTTINEAVADTHSLDREQKKEVADKYGLRNVGASSEAEEEERKANEEKEKHIKR